MADSNPDKGTSVAGPHRGQLLPDLSLVSIEGAAVRISDFKGRRNVALVLVGTAGDVLLNQIAAEHAKFLGHEAQLIAVVYGTREQATSLKKRGHWPFLVAAEPTLALHHRLGAGNCEVDDLMAIYLTDRWGEIFYKYQSGGGMPRPNTGDLLDWLTFIEMQCEECFPPEWPA